MSKHTKSRWRIAQDSWGRSELLIQSGDKTIAEVLLNSQAHNEQMANAHLIASATDMLEVLTEIVKALESDAYCLTSALSRGDHSLAQILAHCRALASGVIVKAQGRGE